ncbi:hypothetical protein Cgig2_025066 [Carnegiea gigantea]|uniref:Uncharacterized protein n=1 Tax=Carnegiea gigantea TaxID=171969 RepID=A0A9Q1JQZ0_9CARY|nr:hypothetical protein Cgig2_025066 [Carnegiea gigantea]
MESNHNQMLQVMASLTAHIKHQVREIQHLRQIHPGPTSKGRFSAKPTGCIKKSALLVVPRGEVMGWALRCPRRSMSQSRGREQASTASGKAASGMSSDERNQMQISARSLMPPPRPMIPSTSRGNSCTPINTSNGRNATYSSDRGFSSSQTGQSSNISSNSEASRRQRKRRPKKKN